MFPDYYFISGFLNINPVHSKTRKKSCSQKTTEPYPDSQVILQQELRIRICCTLSINIVDACIPVYASCVFSLRVRCQMLVLTIITVLQFWQLRYEMLARPINLFLWHCVKDNVVLQALHPSSKCLYTKSKSTTLRPLKGEVGYELFTSKLSNSDMADNFIAYRCSSFIHLHLILSSSHFQSLCLSFQWRGLMGCLFGISERATFKEHWK